MPDRKTAVFVSYSHADEALVDPVVKLLSVNDALVFQDKKSIPPGKRWRNEIARALAGARLVVVFWCDHSHRSTEVAAEWRAALDQDKDLLPVLLDATPLPPELGEYQWVDFRSTVGPAHGAAIPEVAPAPRARPVRGWTFAVLAGAAAAAGIASWAALAWWRTRESVIAFQSPGSTQDPSPGMSFAGTALITGVVLAAAAWIGWLLLRPRRRRPAGAETGALPGGVERRIATELETEILRRAASGRDAVS